MNQRAKGHPGDIGFAELMRAGQVAYVKGRRQKAHHIWRRAAVLRPCEERVWQALLNVVETEDDRRVCLENIVVLNPKNRQARYQLTYTLGQQFQGDAGASFPLPYEKPRMWRYVVLRGFEAVLLGVLLAALLSILLYH